MVATELAEVAVDPMMVEAVALSVEFIDGQIDPSSAGFMAAIRGDLGWFGIELPSDEDAADAMIKDALIMLLALEMGDDKGGNGRVISPDFKHEIKRYCDAAKACEQQNHAA